MWLKKLSILLIIFFANVPALALEYEVTYYLIPGKSTPANVIKSSYYTDNCDTFTKKRIEKSIINSFDKIIDETEEKASKIVIKESNSIIDNLMPSKWGDQSLITTLIFLNVSNWVLTLDIVQLSQEQEEKKKKAQELNIWITDQDGHSKQYFLSPILGRNPSYRDVNIYYPALMITEFFIYKFLLPEKYKRGFLFGCIAFEAACTMNSVYLEGKLNF